MFVSDPQLTWTMVIYTKCQSIEENWLSLSWKPSNGKGLWAQITLSMFRLLSALSKSTLCFYIYLPSCIWKTLFLIDFIIFHPFSCYTWVLEEWTVLQLNHLGLCIIMSLLSTYWPDMGLCVNCHLLKKQLLWWGLSDALICGYGNMSCEIVLLLHTLNRIIVVAPPNTHTHTESMIHLATVSSSTRQCHIVLSHETHHNSSQKEIGWSHNMIATVTHY